MSRPSAGVFRVRFQTIRRRQTLDLPHGYRHEASLLMSVCINGQFVEVPPTNSTNFVQCRMVAFGADTFEIVYRSLKEGNCCGEHTAANLLN